MPLYELYVISKPVKQAIELSPLMHHVCRIVLNPTAPSADPKKLSENIIRRIDYLGTRRLAYRIKPHGEVMDGAYNYSGAHWIVQFWANPAGQAAIMTRLRHEAELLRHFVFKRGDSLFDYANLPSQL